MRPSRLRIAAVLAVVVASVSIVDEAAPARPARDARVRPDLLGDMPADSIGKEAAGLLARVRSSITDAERYAAMMANASTEDSLVLRKQLAARQTEALTAVHELADALLALEKERPRPELRDRVENAFRRITPRLWAHIGDLRREIDRVRANRPSVDKEERIPLEERVAGLTRSLDAVFSLSQDHLVKERQVGLDVTADSVMLAGLFEARVDELSGRIDLALERIDNIEARRKDDPNNADLLSLRAAEQMTLATNTTSMRAMLDLMDRLDLPTSAYRAQLVTATRDFATGIRDAGVATSLARRAWKSTTKWISTDGLHWALKVLVFAGIVLVSWLVGRLVSAGVARAFHHSPGNISELFQRMIVASVGKLVLALGLVVALAQMGVSLGPLLAGVGVVGFILGFALQDSLSNFAAGMMILFYRPYDVGDMVEVAGAFGKVDQMSLVSTSILTIDNQLLVVPNAKIWGDVIKNVTAKSVRRVDMVFSISYADDIAKTERVLAGILEKHEKVLRDPAPIVRLHKLGESSVDFVVRPWVNVDDYWDVYWDVTRAVKSRFDEESITIPFPQRDMHVRERKP